MIFFTIVPTVAMAQARNSNSPHNRLLEAALFLYFGDFGKNFYNYEDLITGNNIPKSTMTYPINPGIEGAFYPLNMYYALWGEPSFTLSAVARNIGLEGAAVYLWYGGFVSFQKESDCRIYTETCSKNENLNIFNANISDQIITRVGFQVSIPLHVFENGSAIKARVAIGQYATRITPEAWTKKFFSNSGINFDETILKDYYARLFLSWDISSNVSSIGGYLGIAVVYVRRTLGFNQQGINVRHNDIHWQLIAGVAY